MTEEYISNIYINLIDKTNKISDDLIRKNINIKIYLSQHLLMNGYYKVFILEVKDIMKNYAQDYIKEDFKLILKNSINLIKQKNLEQIQLVEKISYSTIKNENLELFNAINDLYEKEFSFNDLEKLNKTIDLINSINNRNNKLNTVLTILNNIKKIITDELFVVSEIEEILK